MKAAIILAVGLAAVSTAVASQIISVDMVDASDGIQLPPLGVVCIDVLVDVSDGDSWTAAGVRGAAVGGATLRYATDPNTGQNVLTNPGTQNRFVTFMSEPRPRDGNIRYTNGGAAAAGRYCPVGQSVIVLPTEVNVAYFASPPETIGSPTVDGAIFRIALNRPADLPSWGTIAARPGRAPPDSDLLRALFESYCPSPPDQGTVTASFDVTTLTGFDWHVAWIVPEPGAIGLLVLASAGFARRRV